MDNNLATKHDLKNVELALKNDIVLILKDIMWIKVIGGLILASITISTTILGILIKH